MIKNLTEPEKKHIEAFRKRGMEYPYIAAEIVVERHLMEFVHLQGEIEAYFEELGKKNEMKRCNRCGYEGGGHFYSARGLDLCPACYEAWQFLEEDFFNQFLGIELGAERKKNEKMVAAEG